MNLTEETDESLYSRFLTAGDEEDLRVLLLRHREALTFFLYSYVRNAEDAEELMLDSFAEVAAGRTMFAGRSSFKTWLFAIARNKARMFLRKHRPVTVPLDELPEQAAGPKADPLGELIADERKQSLYRAMGELNPEERELLHLVYLDEMSYEEVARVLGKSRKQIYRLAERGREKMKKRMADPEGAR